MFPRFLSFTDQMQALINLSGLTLHVLIRLILIIKQIPISFNQDLHAGDFNTGRGGRRPHPGNWNFRRYSVL